MLEAAMQEGTRRNYSLFVTTSQDIHLPNGDIYIKKHMDGVIFAGEVDIRVIEEFRKQSIPVVLVNNYLDMDGLVCISADHYAVLCRLRNIFASWDIVKSACCPAGFHHKLVKLV